MDADVLRLTDANHLPELFDMSRIDVLLADLEDLLNPGIQKILLLQYPRVVQIVAVLKDAMNSNDSLAALHNRLRLFAAVDAVSAQQLSRVSDLIHQAMDAAHQLRQKVELQNLLSQQDLQLRSKTLELKKNVESRQQSLVESRRKNLISKFRWETLKKSLEAIHISSSISEIELNLSAVLKDSLKLTLLKISFSSASISLQGKQLDQFSHYSVTLFRSHENPLGSIVFLRDKSIPFLKEEKEFLGRIAEAVSLAIDRVQQLELAENFREQWQATFNAVSDPVALIAPDYHILQANSAFLTKHPQIDSQKCYEKLFSRSEPCIGCRFGKNFRLNEGSTTYQIFSQTALMDPLLGTIYVNHYQDISEQDRIERKMAESAKLAELGTIGSSIAHELNNPLGGLISFLQLIRMDLPKDSSIMEDLQEMEKGALRCKDIIQNLLGFTRSSALEGAQRLDLRTVLSKVCGILNLQLKSRGSEIKFTEPAAELPIQGHPNLLAQAFMSFIQAYFFSEKGSLPSLEIVIEMSDQIEVHLLDKEFDNGHENQTRTEVQPATLSISHQIFKDHQAIVSIDTSDPHRRHVKISFPQELDRA